MVRISEPCHLWHFEPQIHLLWGTSNHLNFMSTCSCHRSSKYLVKNDFFSTSMYWTILIFETVGWVKQTAFHILSKPHAFKSRLMINKGCLGGNSYVILWAVGIKYDQIPWRILSNRGAIYMIHCEKLTASVSPRYQKYHLSYDYQDCLQPLSNILQSQRYTWLRTTALNVNQRKQEGKLDIKLSQKI